MALSLQALRLVILRNIVNVATYVKRSPYWSGEDQPDEIKTYPGKEYLFASRIFRPRNPKSSKLPLIIRVHGGGFMVGNPAIEDKYCRFIADRTESVVVSIDYRKAPQNEFPAALNDVVDLCLQIVEDATLDIDAGKIFLSGVSAGGNLALAAMRDVRVRDKIFGMILETPVAELVTPFEEKIASRPDSNVPDFLGEKYKDVKHLYLGTQDIPLDDVRLSPGLFSKRDDFPENVYVLGAEHDMLCREAEVMAEKLAAGTARTPHGNGWSTGSVRWYLVRGQKHAFEAFPEKDKEVDEARLAAVQAMLQDMADWVKAICRK